MFILQIKDLYNSFSTILGGAEKKNAPTRFPKAVLSTTLLQDAVIFALIS